MLKIILFLVYSWQKKWWKSSSWELPYKWILHKNFLSRFRQL